MTVIVCPATDDRVSNLIRCSCFVALFERITLRTFSRKACMFFPEGVIRSLLPYLRSFLPVSGPSVLRRPSLWGGPPSPQRPSEWNNSLRLLAGISN